jgi:hypothetical protein
MSEVCTGHKASRYDHIWNALRHLEKNVIVHGNIS